MGDFQLENVKKIKKDRKPVIKISAKNKRGNRRVIPKIIEMFKLNKIEIEQGKLITNIRHKKSNT